MASPEYVVLAVEAEKGGEHRETVATLEDALDTVRHLAVEIVEGGRKPLRFEIACTTPGVKVRSRGTPRYRFFVNARGEGAGGDGSELDPWAAPDTAAEQLAAHHRKGVLELREGQRIRLVHHDTFGATSLERRKKAAEGLARVVFSFVVAAMIIPVLAIIGYLFYRAWPVLSWSFIFRNPEAYMTAGGIWAPLVGTFYLAIISLLIDAPIGILAAIYLNEYAPDNWFTRTINLAVLNLAGVPSIVHGLFGFGAFVLFARMGKSVLAASCTLAVMSLPVIVTSAREALASVPMSFREACWNMGATRWQTIRTIVLPNSMSGILTGVIFEICRTAGETAPILFTGAVFYYSGLAESGVDWLLPYGLFDTCMALQYHLFALTTQVRGVSEEIQFGTAAVLIALTLCINSVSISLRVYLRSRKKW